MSQRQPLVTGGIVDGLQYGINPPAHYPTPPDFLAHTLRIIQPGSVIIGAASPDITSGADTDDGWFLSDFYAFNYLLKGLGKEQIWLTAVDPRKLVDKYGDYLLGNEFEGRKVVLSKQLLDSSEITTPTVVEPKNMIDRFVEEVREKSMEAAREKRPLLLMIFCHGLPNHNFLLNDEDEEAGLTTQRLKEAIADGCRVTLVSTACYSGGWVALNSEDLGHVPLNATAMAAADQRSLSNAWHNSHSIRERACGSVFASTVIKSLTSTNGVAMQPEDPNDNQVATFNAYTRSIIDICRSDVTKFWDQQTFTFSAQDDQWEGPWYGRTGISRDIPLGHFRDRWNQLVNVPYAGDPTTKLLLGPHPSNTDKTATAQPGPTGGGLRPTHLREKMTRAMFTGDISMMARLFRETCPGDWHRGWGVGLGSMLNDAVKYGIEPEKRRIRQHIDITEFIKYRWELAETADYLVQQHKLRKPDDKSCILWNDFAWSTPTTRIIPGYADRFSRAFSYLVHKEFNPTPMHSQGPYFDRFTRYMAAAVALTDLSEKENDRVLESLVDYMDKYKEFYIKICIEDEGVIQKKREWHKAIGR